MKKTVFLVIAVMLLTLAFAGAAAANEAPVEDYVGKGMELAEGEMGIVSIEIDEDEDYVGKDMDLAEGEAGITSIGADEEDEKSSLPLYGGIGFLTAGLFFFAYKRSVA